MPLLIILLIVAIPLVELTVLVDVAGRIGVLEAVGLTVLTAIGGLALVRQQGLAVVLEAQKAAERGEPPVAEIIEGLFIVLAGVALLLPGFISDSVGLLLLVPPVRKLLAGLGLWRMARYSRHVTIIRTNSGETIIDNPEYEEVSDDTDHQTRR